MSKRRGPGNRTQQMNLLHQPMRKRKLLCRRTPGPTGANWARRRRNTSAPCHPPRKSNTSDSKHRERNSFTTQPRNGSGKKEN